MDGSASGSAPTASADGLDAVRLPAFSALVVDVASAMRLHAQQAALADFVWHMLETDYQIYLCSSSGSEGGIGTLGGESFAHPRLTWLRGDLPPGAETMARFPALAAPTTLWISDDERVLQWAREKGLAFVSLERKSASFAADLQRLGWGDLALLLDATARTVREVGAAIAELRKARPAGPIVVGIGGPPESGYERFAEALKGELEAHGTPLVEVLDLSSFLSGAPAERGSRKTAVRSFPANAGDEWLLKHVLRPLAKGEEVYVEKAPPLVPRNFRNRFPLYLGAESVVLVIGETVFQRALRETMHLAILLEVAPRETARRLYGIPEGQEFDEQFTKQYLEHDGREYEQYLARDQVVAQAEIRIGADSPRRFEILPVAGRAN